MSYIHMHVDHHTHRGEVIPDLQLQVGLQQGGQLAVGGHEQEEVRRDQEQTQEAGAQHHQQVGRQDAASPPEVELQHGLGGEAEEGRGGSGRATPGQNRVHQVAGEDEEPEMDSLIWKTRFLIVNQVWFGQMRCL